MAPDDARKKFNVHKADAKRRGIVFLLTLEEWWSWWSADGRWERRGRGKDMLVMARFGDVGPYALNNIHPATHAQNMVESRGVRRSEATREFHRQRKARGLLPNLAVRGAGHPNSRPVETPAGAFESGALAADALGVSRNCVYDRIRRGDTGYRWRDEIERLNK